jgi:hypothetical protein
MRAISLKYPILMWASGSVLLIMTLVPFHAFLTVWLSSLIGHYTALRLWDEVLLALAALVVLILLLIDHHMRSHTLPRRLVQLVLLYILVTLVCGLVAFKQQHVTEKSLGYGLIVDLRFLVFFLIAWSLSLRTKRLQDRWRGALLFPATLVVIFGLLQAFLLPTGFLHHFGYGPQTISPVETINHNQHYLRIMSTLRGANPLGAYLVIPISLLSVLILRGHGYRRYKLLWAGAVLTLFFSFSRSAWLGAIISIAIIAALSLRSNKMRRRLLMAVSGFIVLAAVLTASLWHNVHFQNLVFHTQEGSSIKATSDEGHAAALRAGMHDMVHRPFGRGPGTAGPASIYNQPHGTRIAENYFIQIGQETGWLGLGLFLLINAGVGYLLWLRRGDPLALALFASLIGLSFINLLSHAWTDDTLAFIWWGLAGLSLAPGPEKS